MCCAAFGCLQLRAAAALQLPVIVTEQYPKALGNTVEELREFIPQGAPGGMAGGRARPGQINCSQRGGMVVGRPAASACRGTVWPPASFRCADLHPVPPLFTRLPCPCAGAVVAKTLFSMCTEEVNAAFQALPGVKKVLIVGIETHVCVLQTSLDLLGEALEWEGGCGGGVCGYAAC